MNLKVKKSHPFVVEDTGNAPMLELPKSPVLLLYESSKSQPISELRMQR